MPWTTEHFSLTCEGRPLDLAVRTAGAGRPLMAVHGLFGSGLHFLPLLESPPEGYQVFAPDLPGAGESEDLLGPPDPYLTAAVLHALVNALGRKPVDLLGHSLGALGTALFAWQHPGSVRRLVLSCPAGLIPPESGMKPLPWPFLNRLAMDLMAQSALGPIFLRRLGADLAILRPTSVTALRWSLKEARSAARLTRLPEVPLLPGRLRFLSPKLRILAGTHDGFFPAHKIQNAFPDLPFQGVEGSHLAFLGEPDVWLQALLEALA